MLKAKLVVVGGDAKAKEINLKLPCIIGRGRDATLTLPHPLVSRQHTEITERDGRLFVKDLGSLNGSFLNNKRIEKEEPLDPNQLLTLGNVTFRAVYVPGSSSADSDSQEYAQSDEAAKNVELEPLPRQNFDKETVYDEEKSNQSSDTDKSIVEEGASTVSKTPLKDKRRAIESAVSESPSNIFVEIEGVEKVAPASSLEGLPSAPSAMSFASGIDLAGDTQPESVDDSDLDIVPDAVPKIEEGSRLDSFIKKLPR